MSGNPLDLANLLTGGRFAITLLDLANVDSAVEDELLVDKSDPTHPIYYKTKDGRVQRVGGDVLNLEDLSRIESSITKTLQHAKEYTDEIASRGVGGDLGGISLFRYEYTIDIVRDNTSTVQIPLSTYSSRDVVLVSTNTVVPSPTDKRLGYSINDQGLITFKTPLSAGSSVYIVVLKNIPIGPEGAVDAKVLLEGSVTADRLEPELQEKIESAASSIPVSSTPPTGDLKKNMLWYEVI